MRNPCSGSVLGLLAAAVVLAAGWMLAELRATTPLIDMKMMRGPARRLRRGQAPAGDRRADHARGGRQDGEPRHHRRRRHHAAFTSSAPGSGNNVSWTITLGRDPEAAPTDTHPGHDVSDWVQLSPAPWFSMALCDPNSFPLTPCTPKSDSNAPTCVGPNCTSGLGGGSAFMEMQFYPPGQPPFVDNVSCDATHWCAALTIDSLECTPAFASCPGGQWR